MNLGKNFLCDVIRVVAIAQDAIADAVDPGCVALDDLTKSRFIASLQSHYQLSVIRFALFWKAISASGTNLSGPASHLSSVSASQVMCVLFSASE